MAGLVSENSCHASAYFSVVHEKNYQVTFGPSNSDFLPGSLVRVEVIFKNSASDDLSVSQELVVLDSAEVKVWRTLINLPLEAGGSSAIQLMIPLPKKPGTYTLRPGQDADICSGVIPSTIFNVIQPVKSPRLKKILVHTPDFENGLAVFIKSWGIKAPTFSWAQVLLLGKNSWARYAAGESEIAQLITRALRREMSVIFLDFGTSDSLVTEPAKFVLPYDVVVKLIPLRSTDPCVVLKSDHQELIYGPGKGLICRWNGYNGITLPATEMYFEGKDGKINALATSGNNPVRFPLVEIVPSNGKGKLYLSQLITDGRLDESLEPLRYIPEIPAYDPMAVQFLLNLISASVGDNLLK